MILSYFVGLWLTATAPALQADTRALIEQALDEPATITLEKIKLADAIGLLTRQTGVTIVMPRDVMNLVPHGGQTLIEKVEIANVPLREGLAKLFTPLGMNFVIVENHVEIVPKEALLCLGRAPTWTELDVLAWLSATQPGIDAQSLADLKERVQFQVPTPEAWKILSEAVRNVGAGAGDEVLTVACAHHGWGWCMSDRWLVIAPFERQIQRQLQQPITIRLNNRSLFDVLAAVGQQVGVPMRAEPGAIASLPVPLQANFYLNVQNEPAELALEKIASATGLGYLISQEGVVFYQPAARTATAAEPQGQARPSSADPYVAKLVIELPEGKSIEWLIRASELPEDLRGRRQRDLDECFDTYRRRDEGTKVRKD